VAVAVSAQQGLRVLDEAVRLLDVLQAQPRYASASEPDASGHAPHAGGECQFCPLCRGLTVLRELREANPEAVGRMTQAVADLAGAIGDLVVGPDRAHPRAAAAEQTADPGVDHTPDPAAETGNRWYATDGPSGARSTSRTTVQRIDVTE
jgi:hypothetical protein